MLAFNTQQSSIYTTTNNNNNQKDFAFSSVLTTPNITMLNARLEGEGGGGGGGGNEKTINNETNTND